MAPLFFELAWQNHFQDYYPQTSTLLSALLALMEGYQGQGAHIKMAIPLEDGFWLFCANHGQQKTTLSSNI